ncbi:transcriptional regulator with XRE-family HTH domain [Rhizobium petrolearium]|uniref:Helix-turn-helix transcriptional regulator n=1 Tax=Neorhizobium petrolearium TaxID=515361 RepID=A0ABY8LWI0_9HYPH|nr:helix-turn-helix transcriptional regulator [Neorhizobium petrolearium]MBP1847841.1 transcriptional regulator with XRE-family HTH domain [Neorhizobium petrolearium]MCC2611061.1 helix-turn-helix domain-containing protein [Neorhizobium petrolearium]WGI66278.1 helix-turn-helix transcriptional regulator [Neorhizobium petrolearium]
MYDGQIVSAFATDDTIGGRISLARDALNMSIEDASRIVGVTSETWQNWENDRSDPRANLLDRIAGALKVSLAWLLSGRGTGPVWEDLSFDEAGERYLLH